jgi:hypothetical protein
MSSNVRNVAPPDPGADRTILVFASAWISMACGSFVISTNADFVCRHVSLDRKSATSMQSAALIIEYELSQA